MNRIATRLVAALLFFAAPALFAAPRPGTDVELKAIPSYVDRLFLPVVPDAENTLAIETLAIDSVLEAPAGFDVAARNGALVVSSTDGEHAGYARVSAGGRELNVTLVNVVPYDAMKNGKLDGYRIGEYASKPLKGLSQYEQPRGFIRLSGSKESMWVSDHYRMKDFQCKLDGTTKFLILRTEALLKLEILQHELEASHGLNFTRFTVMSGYRTPYYNSKIGNETGYSRHLYGDAMDIYIDENADGNMDDVNRDGRIDTGDARFLLKVAAQIDDSKEWNWLKGGAGVYHANAAHGPYIHVDARGYVARWGAINEPGGGVGTSRASRSK
ncbi:MAG TPA: D-Ala-D-Ala carboxypeptidase family metallohydrolase [Thermoanaerobaculia bacterium]|nr:D-Ala-D-Ala carboxypeptidase family metallohydrolase [Thermoanaerobaculia bacterium]